MLKAIWAQAHDSSGRPVIGRHGTLPWHLPEDLAHFQQLTSGHAVIMGRRTWESLPDKARPLPGRVNIVVTSHDVLDGASTVGSLAGAVELASHLQDTGDLAYGATLWVIGGQRMYRDAVELAEELYVTEIDLEVDGDAFAPEVDPERWVLSSTTPTQVSSTGLSYRFVTYRRA